MPQHKRNEGKIRKIIDLDPETIEIIDRYAFNIGSDFKNFVQDSIDEIAFLAKNQHPEAVRKPKKKILGLKNFKLPVANTNIILDTNSNKSNGQEKSSQK